MKLSIIICTRDRAYAIGSCLDAVAAAIARVAPVEAEVVVVDNASSDNTSAIVKAWAQGRTFPVQLVHEPQKGLSNARNCGIGSARGELLVFTDDDCRMERDYLADALRHDAADTEPVLRGGRIDLGDTADMLLSIKTQAKDERWSKALRSARRINMADTIYGCNMTMRRTLADRLGLFDNRFGAGSDIPGGEDTDYIYRAYLAGIAIEYVGDMAVAHFHGRRTPEDGNKLLRNYSVGTGALFIKYLLKDPNLCRPLYWDLKNAAKEIVSGKNLFMPEIHFSYRNKTARYFVGMKRYIFRR